MGWWGRARRDRTVAQAAAEAAANDATVAGVPAAVGSTAGTMAWLAPQASRLGREAAEVRGSVDDAAKAAEAQAGALHQVAQDLDAVLQAQGRIGEETRAGVQAVGGAAQAVQAIAEEVGGIVESLRQVSQVASQITQIALQTRLVAFNASVEAKRAGDAGRGFGVVADAVRELAARVEASSKDIAGTVGRLDGRIAALAQEIARPQEGAAGGQVHRALAEVEQGVDRIRRAAEASAATCAEVERRMAALEGEVRGTTQGLAATRERTETFLRIAEELIEQVAASGTETEDTPYIRAAQAAASQISRLLDDALTSGAIGAAELFDEQYAPVEGSDPKQHLTRFVPLAERLFPQVQEKLLQLSDKVVFCIAVDRNGYVPCHNRQYCQPQRPGDPVWNAANSRTRRIFDDRTGLASARNTKPFLLQTYRRDMGGGRFVVMKEAAAPITVAGRHWGALRLAYRF